ncbi:2-dehydropantoate 2-reductase [Vibrio sp. 10N.261.46.E12]|uniref:2-dehydropantoate 2-reductase n=1 Tax=unclassified Vibrio TaxID=2614977 RepID=UPI000977D879|nr:MULTISPECIES: 2-dehydropantoate 2-reductase [unclassified Vibrio]OMO35378.1 2-dehydropantoate 2-reductase [Vibrio sp. 10N.261.45.E1]PMJ25483.1 2-dehydropantoate 2-reductase [Vibrio sp. 10N.286.45.B6]PML88900.1 2-dehydropantoate 2-reductase [Vibrio sp. 10N.261.49.E11]PMM64919.1 2-dehydropantoate 2-reductase [Vibrio sp. 10N.261.46.F12]PMM81335.1 2-dehydropantoate 2-reductase [Vibrio sp. 10N.261.46.E8]
MNITIVGPGAIGSLWAIKLLQAGHNVYLWSRSTDNSIDLSLDGQASLSFSNNNIEKLSESDLVIITVKAWQVEKATTPLLQHLDSDTILMFMHNGMGAVDNIATQINDHPVILATTTQAAFKPDRNNVSHTGLGQTQLGAFNQTGQQCSFLVDVLDNALPAMNWNPQIKAALWTKLAINCAINPLTGLEQIKNGELAGQRFGDILSSVAEELTQVMQAEEIACSFDELEASIKQVIQATAQNNSSMKQDMFYQRKTEIDFITGHLIKTARKHQIEVPVNQKLFAMVKERENSWNHQD